MDRARSLEEARERLCIAAAAARRRMDNGSVDVAFDGGVQFRVHSGVVFYAEELRMTLNRGVVMIELDAVGGTRGPRREWCWVPLDTPMCVAAICDLQMIRALENREGVVLPRACVTTPLIMEEALPDILSGLDDVD